MNRNLRKMLRRSIKATFGRYVAILAIVALGVGFYEAALLGGFAIFFVMTMLQKMDNRVHRKTKSLEVYIEVNETLTLGQLMQALRERDLEMQDIQRESGLESEGVGNRAYTATIKGPKRTHHIELVEEVRSVKGVVYVEEL